VAEHVLSESQIRLGLAIQTDLDNHGTALLPSSDFRDVFGQNTDLQVWLFMANLWSPVYDSVLDLLTITQNPGIRPCPIEALAERVKKAQ
jgi:hypothetical protein